MADPPVRGISGNPHITAVLFSNGFIEGKSKSEVVQLQKEVEIIYFSIPKVEISLTRGVANNGDVRDKGRMVGKSTKIRIEFAINGSKAVIVREGPAKWTRMLLWDTRTDRIVPGQWIHSHVPYFTINSDASLVLAFIQSYRRRHGCGPWVALSRSPWFTALGIWKIGDSWGGRCGFITDQKIFVTPGIEEVEFEGKLRKGMSWTTTGPAPSRDRRGWEAVSKDGEPVLLRRKAKSRKLVLTLMQNLPDWNLTLVERTPYGERQETFEKVHFADLDQQERVVLTRRDGKVIRVASTNAGFHTEKIFDFSQMAPEPIDAPKAASRW